MSRLYDRLLTSKSIRKETKLSFRKHPPVVVSADNIARYVCSNPDIAPRWDKQPIYRSPFDYIFIEAHRPADRLDLPYAWGVGFLWKESIEYFSTPSMEHIEYEFEGVAYVDDYSDGFDGSWIPMHSEIFIQDGISTDVNDGGSMAFAIDRDGNFLNEASQHWALLGDRYTRVVYDPDGYRGVRHVLTEEGERIIFYLITPLMMALTLINCKNVELTDEVPSPSAIREYRRREKGDLVTYKTIKVNPMRTVKHLSDPDLQQAPDNSTERPLPLHIARGHFKDYRDSKGLFGNPALKGVYWWDQHVRGDIKNGAVVKDYEVQAPKEKV